MIDPTEPDDPKQRLENWIVEELPTILKQRGATDDEVQDVVIRLLTLIAAGRGPQSIDHAVRLAFTILNGFRKNRRRRAWLEPKSSSDLRPKSADDERDPMDAQAGPESKPIDRMFVQELFVKVRECVAALPEDKRFVLTARYYGGLTYDEIAAREEISKVNCRARFSRALKAVFNCLLGKDVEPEDVFTVWQARTDD